ncbi:hypothetical protein D3C81_1641950 [compost metagenome]
MALDRSNAVGLEQGGNAAGQVLDDASLAANHRSDVHFDFASRDTVNVEAFFRFLVFPGTVEQRLGRNAAHVQAGAAQGLLAFSVGVLLDAGSGQTQLRRLDGSHVATRASTDHYYVKFLRHSKILFFAASVKPQASSQTAVTRSLQLETCSCFYQISSNRRAGSSSRFLMVTRKVTASLPSIRR